MVRWVQPHRCLREPFQAVKSPAMKRPILIHPDPRLKKTAQDVTDLSDELRTLADDMMETMYAAPGIGLAAPHIDAGTQRLTRD